MFRQTDEWDLTGLDNFIEKRIDFCGEQELQDWIEKIGVVLRKNPIAIMNIISSNKDLPSVYALENLADKMEIKDCKDKLAALYDKCLDTLVKDCAWNQFDLKRCVSIMPQYTDNMIKNILNNDWHIKRLLEAEKDPKATLKVLSQQYPNYKEEFNDALSRCERVVGLHAPR